MFLQKRNKYMFNPLELLFVIFILLFYPLVFILNYYKLVI